MVEITVQKYARGVGVTVTGTDIDEVCSAYVACDKLVGDMPGFDLGKGRSGAQEGSQGRLRHEQIRAAKATRKALAGSGG